METSQFDVCGKPVSSVIESELSLAAIRLEQGPLFMELASQGRFGIGGGGVP